MAAPKVYTHSVGESSGIGRQIPACAAYRTGDQSLTLNSWNNIVWQAAYFSTSSMWSADNTDEIIIPLNGLYIVTWNAYFTGTAGNGLDIIIGSTGTVNAPRCYQTHTFRSGDATVYTTVSNIGYYQKDDSIYVAAYPASTGGTYKYNTRGGLQVIYLGGLAV